MQLESLLPPKIGIVGFETTGLAERSIALDLIHALSLEAGLMIAFHKDLAFDDETSVWDAIETAPKLDFLVVGLRPTGATLLPRLRDAIATRKAHGLAIPFIVFGGQTALAAPKEVTRGFRKAIAYPGDVETGFSHILRTLSSTYPNYEPPKRLMKKSKRWIAMPAQFSTERCVNAGGSVWIEASRGCRLNCSFCVLSNNNALTNWFPRPINDLLDEIEFIQNKFGIKDFSFADFSSFETEDYIDEFLHEVNQRQIKFTFRCDLRLHVAKRFRHRLRDLYNAGLRAVYVGIETLVSDFQKLYRKGCPGVDIINYLQSIGIRVSAGFITLDPLFSPQDFREQVVGIKEHGILELVATPFKTLRVQRGTDYEKIANEQGIITGLNPDLYTYSYRCLDARMEIVRQIVEFFHQTTKDIYYNPYIENQIQQSGDPTGGRHLHKLHEITTCYKEAQYELLNEISQIVVEDENIDHIIPLILTSAYRFSNRRNTIFDMTAQVYEELLADNIMSYRHDLIRFLNRYQQVPAFDDSLLTI